MANLKELQCQPSVTLLMQIPDEPPVKVEEAGIHVHIYQEKRKIVDDTFGQVTWFDGSQLERDKLLVTMLDKAKKPAA